MTTISLEAHLAYFQAARVAVTEGNDAAGIPLLQKAISLDPNFAMAFAGLGGVYLNTAQNARAIECLHKAYELRERVSDNEKFMITSLYEMQATGNLEAARKELGSWAQSYPRDPAAAGNLGFVCASLGEFQNALAAAQEALRLSPATGRAYEDLAANYMYLNRLDEARATAMEAHKLGDPGGDVYLYQIDFLQHDAAGMDKDVGALMGKPGSEDVVLGLESDTAAYSGKFVRARELTQRAVASARAADEQETAAGYLAASALRDALAGNLDFATRQAQAGLALSHGRDVAAASAMALALAGDSSKAARLAGELANSFPEYTSVQIEFLPMIQACTRLGMGQQASDAAKAIEALARAAPYEFGNMTANQPAPSNGVSLRGEAYLAARQGTAAAAEFQKLLDHPGVVVNFVTGALAHLGLGRAYALAGDNAKARTAYQDFLALWKDADPDVPVLKQAKAEYARLANAGLAHTVQ